MVRSRALTNQELLLLYLRYGRENRSATQQQVAHDLGLSLGTVRRMERQVLRQLRVSSCNPLASGGDGRDEV